MTTATASDLAINGGTPVLESPVPFMAVGLTKKDIAAANEVLESGMLRAASKCAALERRDRFFGLLASIPFFFRSSFKKFAIELMILLPKLFTFSS